MAGLLGMLYSPSGFGKSLACAAAFPNAEFIAQPRSLKAAFATYGILIPDNKIHAVMDLKSAIAKTDEILKRGNDVVIDDMSPIVDYTVDEYRKKYSGYDVFNAAGSDMLHLRKLLEASRGNVMTNAHLGQPRVNKLNGRPIRGGPLFPGQIPEQIITAFDLILRIEVDTSRTVGYPKALMNLGDAADYIYKDRHDVVRGLFPPNLREVLIAAGYQLAYPKGLEWMTGVVEAISTALLGLINGGQIKPEDLARREVVGPFIASMRTKIEEKYSKDVRHQNWVLDCAFDRAVIKRHLATRASVGSYLGG